MAEEAPPPDASDHASVVQISCGSSHTVALLDCNLVASWGRGEDGQLGHGDASQVDAPRAIRLLLDQDVSSVVCGAEYTVAASRAHNQLYSWGWGDFGRLGHGDCADVFVPRQISFFAGVPVRQVACGDTHTLVCTESGELFAFGRNQNGQLGIGHTNDVLSPKPVDNLAAKAVVSVAAGAEHSVVATSDGEVYAWGWGRYGNLGTGERSDRHTPALLDSLVGVRVASVACGWRHSAAVTRDGRVYAWGWARYGQLGLGDNEDRLVPTEVSGLAGRVVTQIAGGWRHTMALDQDGRVFAWGWDKFGQLGIGSDEDQAAPVVVEALAGTPISLIACGWRHTVAVGRGGEVFAWGRGVNGQLGLGAEDDVALPARLEALCRGVARRSALVATAVASGAGGYVAPADRYGVVPSGGAEPPGAAAEAAAPAGAKQQREQAAGDDGGSPAAKRAHVLLAPPGDDAAVPGS